MVSGQGSLQREKILLSSFGVAPRLLIVRLSALGDTLMSTPIPHVLREAFPKAHLGWVVESRCADVVDGNPYLDRLHCWDGTLKGLVRLVREIRAERYEGALDVQGLLKSAVIPWLAGIPVRVGFADGREGSPFFLTHRLPPPSPIPFVSGRSLQLLQALGIPADPKRHRPLFPLTDRHRSVARQRLSALGLSPKRFVVFTPATTRPQKHWANERWGELAERLWNTLRLPALLLAGKNDRPLLERIARHSAVPLPFVHDLSLKEAVAVIEQAAVLVGPDSFPIHAALAVGTLTVALFGPNNPYRFRNEQSVSVLEHNLPCRPCGRRPICGGAFPCMSLITTDEVFAAVERWLAHLQRDTFQPATSPSKPSVVKGRLP